MVAAPDVFRGLSTAVDAAAAVGRGAEAAGWTCTRAPVSDGSEGLLDVVTGQIRRAKVRGPLGESLIVEWRLDERTAFVEAARSSGLTLLGGPDQNDPVNATSAGAGELIAAAVVAGARRVIIGVGGSAATDGGLGAVRALEPHGRLRGVEIVVACDVTTRFVDSAAVFASDKGASLAQVELLSRRLERLAQVYLRDYGTDIRDLAGGGAGGGLAGGLAAIGATLQPGFDVVADQIDLADHLEEADLVITGEAFLDEESFATKAVGGVCRLADEAMVPALVLAGGSLSEQPREFVSLIDNFGPNRLDVDPLGCIEHAVRTRLSQMDR